MRQNWNWNQNQLYSLKTGSLLMVHRIRSVAVFVRGKKADSQYYKSNYVSVMVIWILVTMWNTATKQNETAFFLVRNPGTITNYYSEYLIAPKCRSCTKATYIYRAMQRVVRKSRIYAVKKSVRYRTEVVGPFFSALIRYDTV